MNSEKAQVFAAGDENKPAFVVSEFLLKIAIGLQVEFFFGKINDKIEAAENFATE